MTTERAALLEVWERVRAPLRLRTFAIFLAKKKNEDVAAISHIVAISDDRDQGAEDFMAICAEKSLNGPYYQPYFRVRGDSELMMARLLIPHMRAWDFKTGKKVIR